MYECVYIRAQRRERKDCLCSLSAWLDGGGLRSGFEDRPERSSATFSAPTHSRDSHGLQKHHAKQNSTNVALQRDIYDYGGSERGEKYSSFFVYFTLLGHFIVSEEVT